MSNEITLSKTTLLVFGALLAAVVVAGFIFSTAAPKTPNNPAYVPAGSNQQPAPAPIPDLAPAQAGSASVQDVYLQATGYGYDKTELDVKAGSPVRLHFTANGAGCGSQLILDAFNVKLISRGEEEVAEFTPAQAGTYSYHCGMYMFRGQLVVS